MTHYDNSSKDKITSGLSREIDQTIKSSKDPLQSAKDILIDHVDRPYFNDLRDELRLLLIFRKIRENPELRGQITTRYGEIYRASDL